MTPKVAELFKMIEDQILAMDVDDRRDSINILSGLRGPDENDPDSRAKDTGTAPIRYAAFPRLMDKDIGEGINGVPWSVDYRPLPTDEEMPTFVGELHKASRSSHFIDHVIYAIRALKQT